MCGRYLDTFRILESDWLLARDSPGTSYFDCLSYRIAEQLIQLLALKGETWGKDVLLHWHFPYCHEFFFNVHVASEAMRDA